MVLTDWIQGYIYTLYSYIWVLIINFNIYRSYLKVFEKLVLITSFSFSFSVLSPKQSTFRSNFPPTKLVQIGQINLAKPLCRVC